MSLESLWLGLSETIMAILVCALVICGKGGAQRSRRRWSEA